VSAECLPGYGTNAKEEKEGKRYLTDAYVPKCDKCAPNSISKGGYEASCVKCPPGQTADYTRTVCSELP
jgi:hypothetical protein